MTRRPPREVAETDSRSKGCRGAELGQTCLSYKDRTGALSVRVALSTMQLGRGEEVNRQAETANPRDSLQELTRHLQGHACCNHQPGRARTRISWRKRKQSSALQRYMDPSIKLVRIVKSCSIPQSGFAVMMMRN
jgi:hypothetical protein